MENGADVAWSGITNAPMISLSLACLKAGITVGGSGPAFQDRPDSNSGCLENWTRRDSNASGHSVCT